MELNPIAMLRAPKEKKRKKNPPPEGIHYVACCLFQLPFPRAFVPSVAKCWKCYLRDHHSELGSPRPSLGRTLETAMALEPGVGPIMSQLPVWLLSWSAALPTLYKAVLPKYADKMFYACFSSFLLAIPTPQHPLSVHTHTHAHTHLRSSFFFLAVYI